MTMPVVVYGIDPGVRGAIACIRLDPLTNRPVFVRCHEFPRKRSKLAPRTKRGKPRARYRLDVAELVELFRSMHVDGPVARCVFVEHPIPMPNQRSNGTLEQGINAGLVTGLAWGLLAPDSVATMHPATWKKIMGVTAEKETCIDLANQIVGHLRPNPEEPLTDGEAEAICIALAGAHIMQEQAK